MKTAKKIVAVMAAVLMLCSILPLSVMAAEETITVTGATGTLASDSLSISWTGTDYQVVNYKNTSSTAIRTSDSAHFRVYVGNQFTVSGIDGALISQVVVNCVSNYLINNSANTVADGWTVSASGTAITYTADSGAASELVITIGKQSRVTSVVITPGTAASADCDHDSLVCGDTCGECGEYTKEHVYSNNCVAECENGCGTANPNYADHVYSGDYDVSCNVCTATREITFPAADSELTVAEINTIAGGMDSGAVTDSKYYVIGEVESIANTTYGNMTIVDENGDSLYIYGTYDADGTNRFDAMADQPEVGQTVKLYGVIGNYNGTNQMQYAWVIEITGGCDHQYDYDCSTNCNVCGEGVREVACVSDSALCQDGLCIYCGNDVTGLGHTYDSDYDADCNYCGEVREVEEAPAYATITFDADKTQRTEYSTSAQVWTEGALVFTNNKASSTSNVGDYSNPVRLYKSSEIIVAYPGMTSIVIDASSVGGTKYATPWADTLTAAGLTYTATDDNIYTVTLAEPVDSITLTCSAQIRALSITVYGSSAEEECEHTYDNEYDVNCNDCGETRDVVAPATAHGFSVSEDVSGLAVKFEMPVDGLGINGTAAVYDDATVEGYKVITMGATVTNGVSTIDIPAVYLCDDDVSSAQFAIRIKNIPADKYDVEITFTPYVIVEIDGVATTIYGEAQVGSYNQYAG